MTHLLFEAHHEAALRASRAELRASTAELLRIVARVRHDLVAAQLAAQLAADATRAAAPTAPTAIAAPER